MMNVHSTPCRSDQNPTTLKVVFNSPYSWVSHLMYYSLNTRRYVHVHAHYSNLANFVCWQGHLVSKRHWILSKLIGNSYTSFMYSLCQEWTFLWNYSIIGPSRWCMQHVRYIVWLWELQPHFHFLISWIRRAGQHFVLKIKRTNKMMTIVQFFD